MNDIDGSCAGTGWSAWASSGSSGELAGVLAAIVFAALILVLTGSGDSDLRLPTLRLFVASLLALGLDAFAFALVSGQVEGSCLKVWTESIVAMGMLVVGTCTALSGVAWLFVAQLESIEVPRTEQFNDVCHEATQLDRLLRMSVYGITGLTVFLLATSAHDYINIAYVDRVKPPWAPFVIPLYLLLVSAILGSILLFRRRCNRRSGRDANSSIQRSLTTAVNAVLVHALMGLAIVGTATSTPTTAWEDIPFPVLLVLLTVALVLPAPILFAIALSVPRLVGQRSEPTASNAKDRGTA